MVGGTAVALHLGHRKSVDIDFFTNAVVDRQRLGSILANHFPGIEIDLQNDHHIRSQMGEIKIDLCDEWTTQFREAPVIENGLRLASIMDLAALKIDAIIERREKKDYIDLYFLFSVLGAQNVLNQFKVYNPHVSDKSVLFALGEVPSAPENRSVMPEMLIDISWREIERTIRKVGKDFFESKKSLHDKRS